MSKELKIPSTWLQVPFSDLFLDPKNNIVGGPFGSNLKSSEYRTEGIPVFRIQNIGRNKFIDKNINYVTEEKAEFLSRHSFESGDIIITKLGAPLGKTCFVPKKYERGIIVADLIRARIDNKNINPKFLVYQFNSPFFIKQFDRFTKGTTRPRIKLSVVRELRFNLPPLKEQDRIVNAIEELFSDLDNGVHNLKIAQNQLRVYRQALLKHAFEGKLTKQWREDNNPESAENLLKLIRTENKKRYRKELSEWEKSVKQWEKENKKEKKPSKPRPIKVLSKFKDSKDNYPLPTSWKWIKIGEFEGHIGSGSTPKGGRSVYLNEGVSFIRSMNIHPNKFVLRGLVFIDKVTHKKMERSQLKEKDVLLNITGASIGRTACVPIGFGEGNVNQHVCIIRPSTNNIMPEYLCHYLNSPKAQGVIQKVNSGATREALNFEQVRNFPFPLATSEEQKMIVHELESKFSIIDHLEETINHGILKSKALYQSILKKAFEGKLVDQVSKNETAFKLVKRIQKERKKYQDEQKLKKKKAPKKTRKMSKKLSIIDVLKASDKPMLAKDVWQQSTHSGDIEEFYSELKNIQDSIKEVKKGTESLLSFTK